MLKILTGLISGIVSGTGMGGGTILILILSVFMRNRPTRSTSYKPSFFRSNINYSNNSINKRKINRLEYRNSISWLWNYRSNYRGKNICKNECGSFKKAFWNFFSRNCNT